MLLTKKDAGRTGTRFSDLRIIDGGMSANIKHAEKLLLEAGMKPEELETLCKNAGVKSGKMSSLAPLRAELVRRGLLPGRPAASTSTAAAAATADIEVPAALVAQVEALEGLVNKLSSPQGLAAHLRGELKALEGKHDRASAQRRGVICRQIRQIAA